MEQSPTGSANSHSVKFSAFMETECSLPCSQDPVTGPDLETSASCPHTVPFKCIYILSSHLRQVLSNAFFSSAFPTEVSYPLPISSMRAGWKFRP